MPSFDCEFRCFLQPSPKSLSTFSSEASRQSDIGARGVFPPPCYAQVHILSSVLLTLLELEVLLFGAHCSGDAAKRYSFFFARRKNKKSLWHFVQARRVVLLFPFSRLSSFSYLECVKRASETGLGRPRLSAIGSDPNDPLRIALN